MDDALLVHVVDRVAHPAKQLDPLLDAQASAITEVRQPRTLNQLHGEVWRTVGGVARFVDLSDAGMAEPRQCLALGVEAGADTGVMQTLADDLQRHPPLDGLGLKRQVDDAHAALAQDFQDVVRADAAWQLGVAAGNEVGVGRAAGRNSAGKLGGDRRVGIVSLQRATFVALIVETGCLRRFRWGVRRRIGWLHDRPLTGWRTGRCRSSRDSA